MVFLGLLENVVDSTDFQFFLFQGLNGFCQGCGLPGCVAVLSNWFAPQDRGKVMGFWEGCQNIGNIIGLLVGELFIQTL